MKHKAILFDNDGVLVDTENLFLDVNTCVFSELGISHTKQDFINYTFITGDGTYGFLKNKGFCDTYIETFWKKRDDLWFNLVEKQSILKKETESTVKHLSKKFKIGIVTNSSKNIFEATYKNSDLLSSVDLVVTREKYTNPKPAPDCYLKAIQELDTPPDQIIVVEDSPRGVAAAKTAGLKTVHIQNKHFPEVTAKADYKINEISELRKLLS